MKTWIINLLAQHGWLLTDRLVHEHTIEADARGFVDGYPQFGRFEPFAKVRIYTEEINDEK